MLLAAFFPLFHNTVIGLPAVGRYIPDVESLVVMLIFTMMAVGLNVVVGYAGLLDLGYVAFYAIGAYTVAVFASTQFGGTNAHPRTIRFGAIAPHSLPGIHISIWLLLLMAAIVTAVLGVLIGLPTLRLRGDYLAIVTLGFGEIVRVLGQITARQPKNVAAVKERSMAELANNLGGAEGFSQIPGYTTLFFVYLFAFVLLILVYRLKYSSKGRALLAVRENEIAAEAMGVDTTRAKVVAFVFSAFFAGIGGALYAHQVGALDPKELGFQKSIDLVIIVVIGGMGSITGVVLGASILVILPEVFRQFADYRMIAYALALITVMIVRPQGIMGVKELWETAWWRRAASRLRRSKP